MARKLLALAAVLLVAFIHGVHAEQSPHSHSELLLRGVLDSTKYDIDAEFNDMNTQHNRRLQNNPGSVTETTTCNTWCKLKESLGLTIIGLLLICLR